MILHSIRQAADRKPETIAVQIQEKEGRSRRSYRELMREVASVSQWLAERGIVQGVRAAILSENRIEWVIAYLAVISRGAVVVPLDAQLTAKEVELLLRNSEAKIVFVSSLHRQKLPAGYSGLIVFFDEGNDAAFPAMAASFPDAMLPPAPGPDTLAALLYTSGTTGDPKGVMLSHANLAANIESIRKLKIVFGDDTFLCILPLHHTYAAMICMLVPLALGATVTILNSLKGPDILACIHDAKVTVLPGVPQIFVGFRNAIFGEIRRKALPLRAIAKVLLALSSVLRKHFRFNPGKKFFSAVHAKFGPQFRLCASGGARLEPSVHADLSNLGFYVIEGYGLTETSPLCTANFVKPGSIGVPIPDVEVKIVNPDPGGQGEIAVRGPNVMLGYFNKPEETAAVLKEGWFFTGDLGYRDRDGFYFITGRSKEMIVLSTGKNIFPDEIEAFYKEIPEIKEICVIQGQRGLEAAVVPDFEYLRAKNVSNSREAIAYRIEDLSRQLPAYKRIMGLKVFKDSLPVTRLGKLRRSKVRELYEKDGERFEKATQATDHAVFAGPTAAKLLDCLAPFSAKKPIVPDDNLELDLGIDSLSRVELIVSIERSFQLNLGESFASQVFTVRDALVKLEELMAAGSSQAERNIQMSWRDILAQEPPGDVRKTLSVKHGMLRKTLLSVLRSVDSVLFSVYGSLSVSGLENIPRQGAYILAPNHVSLADAPAVIAALPRNVFSRTFFLGTTVFFGGPVSSRIANLINVIPVDMETRLHSAMQLSAHVLRQGHVLCVFPEGGRSRDGKLKPFKKGVGIIARELTIPIVPVAVTGTYEMLPAGKVVPRHGKVRVAFGAPIHPQGMDYDGIVKKLRETVADMLQ